jgi:hypothetical protein
MAYAPTAAERARTLAFGVAGASLATPASDSDELIPAHVCDDRGRPLLLLSSQSPAVLALQSEQDLPGTLQITDMTAVPLADRVRGCAWFHGWLTEVPQAERREAAVRILRLHPRPDLLGIGARIPAAEEEWTVLTMEVGEIEVEDGWGSAIVQPEEYAAARPDPFVAIEPGMIEHLDASHRTELAALYRDRFGGEGVVRAMGLDRFGLTLRCLAEDGPLDLRLAFPEPVRDLQGLRCAYRQIFRAAMINP